MKSTVDVKEGLARSLKVEIPAEMVQDAFSRVYKGIQKNATIKGFRKGKAPLAQIKAMYADRVKQDVMEDLLSRNYQKALEEHSLDPIGYPRLNVGELSEEKGFQFTADFEVRPEINLRKIENLPVEKEKVDIEDSAIERIIERIRAERSETVPVFEDRPAQNGDVLKIDFEGFIDNAPLPGGSAQDHMLELGSNSFIPGFEEGLVGVMPGSTKDLSLTFPEDYHNKEIAGKEVLFKVKVHALMKKSLPDLNDEFAKQLGEYNTVSELREAIRGDLMKREESRVKSDLRNRIVKALVEANPVEVPQSLMTQQKQRLIEDVHQRMRDQGMNESQFEEYKQKWDADFESSAATMIQSTFLVDALADKYNLRASNEECEARIREHAMSLNLDYDRVRDFYKDENRSSNLRFQITEEKVLDFLISKADVKEVPKDQLTDTDTDKE